MKTLTKISFFFKEHRIFIQTITAVFIVILAILDYSSVLNLFQKLGYNEYEQALFGITCIIFLEGLPAFLGHNLSRLKDPSNFHKNDEWIASLMCIVSLIATLAIFGLLISMRYEIIQMDNEAAALESTEITDTTEAADDIADDNAPPAPAPSGGGIQLTDHRTHAIGQRFPLLAPILTSVLSFLASSEVYNTSEEERQLFRVELYHRQMLKYKREFQDSYQRFQDVRSIFWSSVADNPDEDIPYYYRDFRNICFAQIRKKLLSSCKASYPSQIDRYNAEVENALSAFVEEIANHSTVPDEIAQISIPDLIEKYESNIENEADSWHYKTAGKYMEAELDRVLSDAIIIAEFNTATAKGRKK